MLANVFSCALVGIDAYLVDVEVDISRGLPTFSTVGLAEGAAEPLPLPVGWNLGDLEVETRLAESVGTRQEPGLCVGLLTETTAVIHG